MPRTPEELAQAMVESLTGESYNSIFMAPPSKPKVSKKFWILNYNAKVDTDLLHGANDKPMVMYLTNEQGNRLVIEAKVNEERIPEVNLYRSHLQPANLMTTVYPGYNQAKLGDAYQNAHDSNGNPTPVNREVLELLKEVGGLVDSTPSLAKNARWNEMLKPKVNLLLKLFK